MPREATELLDFTGRWIRERTPQRGPFNTGVHLRESRRGKPGHDSAFLIAAGTAGFGFRSGEVWLTHVGWSGNSRHLAERANDGTGLIGGGELPLPRLLALQERAHSMISVNTGPAHSAAAMGCPLVVMFTRHAHRAADLYSPVPTTAPVRILQPELSAANVGLSAITPSTVLAEWQALIRA